MSLSEHKPDTPTNEEWAQLCQSVKESLMDEVGTESWYLIIVSPCLLIYVIILFAAYLAPYPYGKGEEELHTIKRHAFHHFACLIAGHHGTCQVLQFPMPFLPCRQNILTNLATHTSIRRPQH
jgi:hypothetical protein